VLQSQRSLLMTSIRNDVTERREVKDRSIEDLLERAKQNEMFKGNFNVMLVISKRKS
jgi:hypothetical protein